MDRVKDKVAVVTGGALGIGRSACILLAKEGARVAVTDIMHEEAKQVVEEIRQAGGIADYWAMDVADEAAISAAFEDIEKKFGPITVLVNNAGIGGANKPTHEITQEEWDKVMAVNVKGVFLCTKYAIPQMQKAGIGSIINLSSIYGLIGNGDVPPYHASKGAIRLMSKNDALIYAKQNIRVNSLHPGFIITPMVENFIAAQEDPDMVRKALEQSHPVGYMGEPDDIGWGIVYLASDESRFVTGSEFIIDGGYTAR